MDLINLVKRFGPQTVVGASVNLVAMNAVLIGTIVSGVELPLLPLIWLEIAFIGMLVLAIVLRRANPREVRQSALLLGPEGAESLTSAKGARREGRGHAIPPRG